MQKRPRLKQAQQDSVLSKSRSTANPAPNMSKDEKDIMEKIQNLLGKRRDESTEIMYPQNSNMVTIKREREENSRLLDEQYTNPLQLINNMQYKEHLLWDPSQYPDDGSDAWKPNSKHKRQRQDCQKCWRALKRLLYIPFKGVEYIMDGGQKSNKIFIKKMMVKGKGDILSKEERIKLKEKSVVDYYVGLTRFIFQFIVMPVMVLVSSSMCLLNLILWNYYRIDTAGNIHYYEYLVDTDYVLLALLMVEILFNISFSEDIDELFDFENMLLIIISLDILWSNTGQPQTVIFNFIHSLRSLRVTKLRYVTRLFTNYINRYLMQLKKDDIQMEVEYFNETEELDKFLVEQMINFFGGLLVQTSMLLALDRSQDFKAFHPYGEDGQSRFDYLKASYYVIITFTTVGYKDIYPRNRVTRLCMIVIMVMNILVITNYIGEIVNRIYQSNPHPEVSEFKDHVVLTGQLEESQIIEFLDELVENDNVQRSMSVIGQLQMGIKCVIVGANEPSNRLRLMIGFIGDRYENEIVYIRDNPLSNSNTWYRKSNLYAASVLFVFNEDVAEAPTVSLTARNAKDENPNLKVNLILNSDLKYAVENDSLYKDIEVMSRRQLNEYIMASSLENPGLSATMSHLFTMKSKSVMDKDEVSKQAQTDDFLFSYMRDMQSEIYQIQIPDFFVGMTYRKFGQILYLHNLSLETDTQNQDRFIYADHLKVNNAITLIAIETISDQNFASMNDEISSQASAPMGKFKSNKIFPSDIEKTLEDVPDRNINLRQSMVLNHFVANQLKVISPQNQDRTNKTYKTDILINPQDYNIKKNDIAYVLCNHYQLANSIESINSNKSLSYIRFLENFEIIKQSIFTAGERQALIEDLYFSLELERSQLVSRQDAPQSLKERERMAKRYYFDLIDCINLPPPVNYDGHIIIFGRLQAFKNMIHVLRRYSGRKVIIYSHLPALLEDWADLCAIFPNVEYFRGNYLSLEHLDILNIKKAHHVLITTQLDDFDPNFPDATGLCLAKIMLDYYEFSKYLVELKEEAKIRFLNNIPKLSSPGIPSFVTSSYLQGNVHLSSMPTSIFAKVVYNNSWFRLINDFVVPKAQITHNQNQTLNTVTITKNVAESFRYFGMLQFALMEQKPSLFGITLIKQKIGSQYQDIKIENLLSKGYIQKISMKYAQIDQKECQLKGIPYDKESTLQKFKAYLHHALGRDIGFRYVLTNPHPYTLIEEGDQLIVIGQMRQSEYIQGQMKSQSSLQTACSMKPKDPLLKMDLKSHIIEGLNQRIAHLKLLDSKFSSLL